MQARTLEKKKEFLDVCSSSELTISEVCKKVGISRWTYYNWKNKDRLFSSEMNNRWTLSDLNKLTAAEEWARNRDWGVTYICKSIGISRWTFYNWWNNNYQFNQYLSRELDNERECWAGKEWLKEHPLYKELFGKPNKISQK